MGTFATIVICFLVSYICSANANYNKPERHVKREYSEKTVPGNTVLKHWDSSNSKRNSLDGDMQNQSNETALISLSKATDGYVVFIKLERTCSIYHPPREWFNKTDVDLLKDNGVGPDEIIVQLEGPSLQTKIAVSQNFCNEYYSLFQVPLGGNYNLKVYRLRNHYEASREQPKFPKMVYEEFLNVFVQITAFHPKACMDSLNGYWVSKWNRMTTVPINVRQKCVGVDERRGLRLSTNVLVSNDYGRERCAKDIELYSWNRKICLPGYNAMLDDFGEEINEHRANVTNTRPQADKFIGKKILFVGDSHMRGLADIFLYHVCHFQVEHLQWNKSFVPLEDHSIQPRATYLEISFKTKAADAFRHNCNYPANDDRCNLFDKGCTDATFAYLGAMYCQSSIANYALGFDYVVVNCGHHPAATTHYSYSFFKTVVTNMFMNFKKMAITEHSQIFWLENTAQPLRQDKWTFYYSDWRTYHRLLLFDGIAKSITGRMSLPIVVLPAFYSTLALFDKMCDCGHYSISAKMPQLLGLLDAIYSSHWNPSKKPLPIAAVSIV